MARNEPHKTQSCDERSPAPAGPLEPRGLREGFDHLGDTLDRQDREGAGWLERLRELAHSPQAASMKALSVLLNDETSYKGLTFKGLRHTVATTLRKAGLDEHRIADILVQKTPSMARHY